MKKFCVLLAVLVVLLGGIGGLVHAEYACETGKELGCFGDASYPFMSRNVPVGIGPDYGTGGGYPDWLASAPQYYYQDRCGMENRTSESYTLFKYMHNPSAPYIYFCPFLDIPADQWIPYTQTQGPELGYVLSDVPIVGSVTVLDRGPYGHAVYVEEIINSNTVRVSEYDKIPGSYSESIINTQGLLFLISSPHGMKGA